MFVVMILAMVSIIGFGLFRKAIGIPSKDAYVKKAGAADSHGRPQCITCKTNHFFLERGGLWTVHQCRICGERCFRS